MRYVFLLLCVFLLGGFVEPVSAQRPPPVPSDSSGARQTQRKSPDLALAYSMAGTLPVVGIGSDSPVGGSLFLVGLIAGPSLGHFYAEASGQAWRGILIRSGAVAAGIGGLAMSTRGTESGAQGFGVLAAAGGLGALGSAVYDVATAAGSAEEYNEQRQRSGLQAQVTPAVGPRGEQVGLTLQIQF